MYVPILILCIKFCLVWFLQGTWRMPTTRGIMWSLSTVLSTIRLYNHVSIQGSKVRGLTFEGQKFNISWYIQKTTLYDAITIKQIYTVFYTRVYNNWCSEFTKKYHDCVYLGLGGLNLTSGDSFWIKRLRGLKYC